MNYFFLLLGFVFSFFVTGYAFIELFFPKISKIYKIPLYFLLSLLLSTNLVYFISLLLGFSRISILISYVVITLFLAFYLFKGRRAEQPFEKKHWIAYAGGILIFLIYLFVMYPAIFTVFHGYGEGYIVMAGSNWQDTAMHQGIIQSISQGNFPPQAPYYSGVPLNYYYFVDFHSAILATLFGNFFPRVLVFDNPFFAAIFFLALYALAFQLTQKKNIALISAVTGSLFSNYLFIHFIRDFTQNIGKYTFWENAFALMRNSNYSIEYGRIFSMSNMADYFLQNRPMAVGLSAFFLSLLIILLAIDSRDRKMFLLAGLICGMMVKFQIFSVLVTLLSFAVALVINFRRKDLVFWIKSGLLFIAPFIFFFCLFSFIFNFNEISSFSLAKENLYFGWWDKGKSLIWYLLFILCNFGLVFIVSIVGIIWGIARRLRKQKIEKNFILISFLVFAFFIVPFLIRFTIYEGDMFKFFYFMVPLSAILSFWFLDEVIKNKRILMPILVFLSVISVFGSFLTLANSALNKNFAYSLDDYAAGIWIRERTPQKSVFVLLPRVHSDVTDIGGRLEVLSYINWPYSHGFNKGRDNVFQRSDDIERLYSFSDDLIEVKEIMDKYKASYIFYGNDEKSRFPQAERNFDRLKYLIKVYDSKDIKIWQLAKQE